MFTIWAKPYDNMPVVKIDVDCIDTARLIWDSLASKGYHMVSAKP